MPNARENKSLAEGSQHLLERKSRNAAEPAEILDIASEQVLDFCKCIAATKRASCTWIPFHALNRTKKGGGRSTGTDSSEAKPLGRKWLLRFLQVFLAARISSADPVVGWKILRYKYATDCTLRFLNLSK